jgi:hypothetical protein
MTQQQTPSKAQLVDALRSSGEELVTRLAALPPEEFERGRYENGWNGRQILAHVASIEWTYPRLLEVARQAGESGRGSGGEAAGPVRRTEPGEASGVATASARGGIDDYNQRQVDKRADASVAELLEEFRRNRAATIAAIEGTEESLLAVPIRSAGGVTGPLAGVFQAVAVGHIQAHVRDILAGESGV